jgi:hypothetical protein
MGDLAGAVAHANAPVVRDGTDPQGQAASSVLRGLPEPDVVAMAGARTSRLERGVAVVAKRVWRRHLLPRARSVGESFHVDHLSRLACCPLETIELTDGGILLYDVAFLPRKLADRSGRS